MSQTTVRQHFIWRSYLAPWTDDGSNTGTISCLRNRKLFSVSLGKIAVEKYFYRTKELSALEKKIIFEMTIKNTTGRQREVNQGWLDLYCAPFELVDDLISGYHSLGYPIEKDHLQGIQEHKNMVTEHIENYHCQLENKGMQYMKLLRQSDLSFWNTVECRNEFALFLCNQYFRTKRMRDSITMGFAKIVSEHREYDKLNPENMWLPLSLICASNLGEHITYGYKAVLLQTEGSHFIVGDQPVVNTYSTFDLDSPVKALELYYPVTPHTALLITTDSQYNAGQMMKIDAHEVMKYNQLEIRCAGDQVFAQEPVHLTGMKMPQA